jgi:two-component system response regulator QseB
VTEAIPLLLVEDDAQLSGLLDRVLTAEGYSVTVAADGQRGLHLALTRPFAVLVVDRGLPAIEGVDLIGRLRSAGCSAPVLVLSARASTQDRVDGLDAGAGDYLAKPFELAELTARLRALLRRDNGTPPTLRVPGGRVERGLRRFTANGGGVVDLSDRETALITVLAGRPHQVFSRAELRALVFVEADSETVVDTYVHYCRRKMGRSVIDTVRGLGYRLGRL